MILNVCDVPDVLKVMRIVRIIITIIKIIVPIILIVSGMLDYARAVRDNDELATKSKLFVKKIIAALLIFFIPTFVNIITNIFDPGNNTYVSCISNATLERIQQLYVNNMELYMKEARSKKDNASYLIARDYTKNIEDESVKKKYLDELEQIKAEIDAKNNGQQTMNGKSYNLSEQDLQFLANVGYCEQGSIDGIKAEISLAANLYELQSKYPTLIDYVKKSGWFACSKTTKVASKQAVEAVRDVIVNGNRVLPPYVNEHDCINCNSKTCSNGNRGDICKIVVNGKTLESMSDIKNKANYISGNTVIYNKYGSVYTFYSFPCSGCDPFGYTASAYNKYNK